MAVRVGPYLLGVRGDSEATMSRLSARLGDHAVAEEADPNFSVRLDDRGSDGPVTRLHTLHRGHDLVGRVRARGALLEVLVEHLEAFACLGRDGVVDLEAGWLLRDGEAVLTPPGWLESLVVAQRRLARDGWRVAHRGFVGIEAESGRVVVDAPRLAPGTADGGDRRVAPGRYRVRLVLVGPSGLEPGPVRRGPVLARLVGRVEAVGHLGAQRTLSGLAAMLARAETRAAPSGSLGQHLARLRR